MAAFSRAAPTSPATRGTGSICVTKAVGRRQVAPNVQRPSFASGRAAPSAAADTKGAAITVPWKRFLDTEPVKPVINFEKDLEALRRERAALLERCQALEQDAELYKSQAAGFWWDYADARKRILGYMDTVDNLYSQLRSEKHARIQAEHRVRTLEGKQ